MAAPELFLGADSATTIADPLVRPGGRRSCLRLGFQTQEFICCLLDTLLLGEIVLSPEAVTQRRLTGKR